MIMNVLNYEDRIEKSKQIPLIGQEAVMQDIPQFNEVIINNIVSPPKKSGKNVKAVVFNMERGVHLEEVVDFLSTCPDLLDVDIILANELDDGNERSKQLDTTKEIATRLGFNYVYGLEFIELASKNNIKGFHGNAILSKWPITWAKAYYPEQFYDWYFSDQPRIGARLAIFAKVDVAGTEVGLITAHLENRTDAKGRFVQMQNIIDESKKYFKEDMSIILGGDFNTCMFVDISTKEVREFLDATKNKKLDVMKEEPLLTLIQDVGYDIEGCNNINVATCRGRMEEVGAVGSRIDWIMTKNMCATEHGEISTLTKACSFAKENSALASFQSVELSDHDAVWVKATVKL